MLDIIQRWCPTIPCYFEGLEFVKGGEGVTYYIQSFFFHKKANILSKMFITDNYYVLIYLPYYVSLYQWQKKSLKVKSEFGRCSLSFGSNFCQKNENYGWHSNHHFLIGRVFPPRDQKKFRLSLHNLCFGRSLGRL